ncbi:MAG: hypothetical protein RDU25_02675 [Patescibacteria group bacterium]|nr:hypothetical protein [Patescibacteria group bacterium]
MSFFVPLLVYLLLPEMIRYVTGKKAKRDLVLATACLLYLISWYLPSPLIDGRNTAFMTHLVGGGIFTGLLWLYVKRQRGWKASWVVEILVLFACVSSLGVANELFELVTVESGLTRLDGSDTWWDLLANTLGASVFWIFYRLTMKNDITRP